MPRLAQKDIPCRDLIRRMNVRRWLVLTLPMSSISATSTALETPHLAAAVPRGKPGNLDLSRFV
jgi:hypothetical protein